MVTFSPDIPDAASYVLDAYEIVEANAFFSDSIDWPVEQEEAQRFIADHATRQEDLYGLIQLLLHDLGDGHSHFIDPEEMTYLYEGNHNNTAPTIEQREGRIGYLGVPSFRGLSGIDEYLTALHAGIAELDEAGTCGWIVDLRDERGGNMWAPLAGLGPLLGVTAEQDVASDANVVGYFVDSDTTRTPWRYSNGVAYIDSEPKAAASDPHELRDPDAPVAVLVGPRTASAGEAIATAFATRPNTRSFGEPTFGVPTGNEVFRLADGAGIALTTVQFADRSGQLYGPVGGLVPDQPGGQEEAVAWLRSQPACGSSALDGSWTMEAATHGRHLDLTGARRTSTVHLDTAGGRISGYGGCNSFQGNFTYEDNVITVTSIGGTVAGCISDAEQALERALAEIMAVPFEVTIEGNEMTWMGNGVTVVYLRNIGIANASD